MATTVEIPSSQRAAVREEASSKTAIQQVPVPTPAAGQILVKIKWSGLCGSDKALLHDEWQAYGVSMSPFAKGVVGHEGAGVVVAIGDGMHDLWKIGDRAGIKWIASTCGDCYFCQGGDEVQCLNVRHSGLSAPGNFQEYCLADGRYTTKLPDGVTDEEAGPILCGGVTAYTACKRSNVQPGQWIVLQGAGGGLGSFAIQYASAMGMRVIAIDTGDEKRTLCTRLGAEVFVDFRTTTDMVAEIMKVTTYGAHGIIVTAGSRQAYQVAPMLLRPNGTVVAVGFPNDPNVVAGAPPMLLSAKRLNVVGSVVGSQQDVDEALDFAVRGLVRSTVTKGKLEDLDEWIVKLQNGQIAGRVVLQVAQ